MNEKELDSMIRRIFSKDFAELPEEERYKRTLEFISAIDENDIKVMVGNNKKNMTSLLNVIKILGRETVAKIMAERLSSLVSTMSSSMHGPEDIERIKKKVESGMGTEAEKMIYEMLNEAKVESDDEPDDSKVGEISDMPSFLHGLSFITLNFMKKTLMKYNIKNMSTSSTLMVPIVLLAANNLANGGYYANHGSQYKSINDSEDDLSKAIMDAKEKAENVINILLNDEDLTERLGLKGMPNDALAIVALAASITYCEASCTNSTTVSDMMEVLSVDDVCDEFNQKFDQKFNQKESKDSPPKFDGSMFSKSKFKEMTNDEGKNFLMDD